VDRRRIELIESGIPAAPIEHEAKPLTDAVAARLIAEARASALRALLLRHAGVQRYPHLPVERFMGAERGGDGDRDEPRLRSSSLLRGHESPKVWMVARRQKSSPAGGSP
jgi:hypothetical protein